MPWDASHAHTSAPYPVIPVARLINTWQPASAHSLAPVWHSGALRTSARLRLRRTHRRRRQARPTGHAASQPRWLVGALGPEPELLGSSSAAWYCQAAPAAGSPPPSTWQAQGDVRSHVQTVRPHRARLPQMSTGCRPSTGALPHTSTARSWLIYHTC